jgi:hypothetical protein
MYPYVSMYDVHNYVIMSVSNYVWSYIFIYKCMSVYGKYGNSVSYIFKYLKSRKVP